MFNEGDLVTDKRRPGVYLYLVLRVSAIGEHPAIDVRSCQTGSQHYNLFPDAFVLTHASYFITKRIKNNTFLTV